MPVEYAHALSRSLTSVENEKQAQERVDELIEVLTRDGKTRALPAILLEFERITQRTQAHKATLTVAKEADAAAALTQLKNTVQDVANINTVVDERLVGGWRYTSGDTLIDASYKFALLELYRRVTTL